MDTAIECMKTRRSIRKYKPDMVPDDLLQKIAEAGTYAASGMGRQPSLIVVVRDRGTRDKLSEMNAKVLGAASDPFYGAPVVIVVLADKGRPTYIQDGSLVIGNMMLAAHELGLGSCWINRAREEFESPEGKALLKEWGIEGDYAGIGHCIVGFPDGPLPEAAPRKKDYIRFA